MRVERKADHGGADARSAEPPAPAPPRIPPVSGAGGVDPNSGRASSKVASGGMSRPMVHRINVDLSGPTLAVFNILLRVERAKLRGRQRRLSARDLGEAILKIYLTSKAQEILEVAADEIERLGEGVRVRSSATGRRGRSPGPRPLRPARAPSAPDAGEGSLRCQ